LQKAIFLYAVRRGRRPLRVFAADNIICPQGQLFPSPTAEEDFLICGRIVSAPTQNHVRLVGDGADQLAVLKDGAAAHECVKRDTTHFLYRSLSNPRLKRKEITQQRHKTAPRSLPTFCQEVISQ